RQISELADFRAGSITEAAVAVVIRVVIVIVRMTPEEKKRRTPSQQEVARVEQMLRTIFTGHAQDGPPGPGGRRDAGELGHASGRREYLNRVAALLSAGPAPNPVPVWTACALSRTAFENGADGGRHGGSKAALLSGPHCHQGQSPADQQLDIVDSD